MRSAVVTIRVNGTEHTLAGATGFNEETLRQIANQAGVAPHEVLKIIQAGGVLQSLPLTTQSNQPHRLVGHIAMITCSKCHRKVPESAACLYCGQTLQQKATNDVDKKFLETDIVEENKAEEKQQVKDTFQDRLKNL